MSGGLLCAIDAGNSFLKLGIFEGVRLKAAFSWPRTESGAIPSTELAAVLPQAAHRFVVACSQCDEALLRGQLQTHNGNAVVNFLTADSPLPFHFVYTSGRPGADRLANVMALRHLAAGHAAVCVDLGTATNVEVVDAHGDFAGGVIIPGLRLGARALAEATGGALPSIDPHADGPPVDAVSNSTQGAVRSGLILAHAGGIDRVLDEIRARLAPQDPAVFVTGGHHAVIMPFLRSRHVAEPHLTLIGLREYASFPVS